MGIDSATAPVARPRTPLDPMTDWTKHLAVVSRPVLIAASLGALACGMASALLVVDLRSDRGAQEPEEPLEAGWSADTAAPVQLNLGDGVGPEWRRSNTEHVEFPPLSTSSSSVRWDVRDTRTGRRLVGTADRDGAELQLVWDLHEGDPQARFSVRLRGVGLEKLRTASISVSLRLPTDRVRVLDSKLGLVSGLGSNLPFTVDPWTPTWLEWRDPAGALTVDGWTGDGMTIRRSGESDALRVDLHLWRPELHPAVRSCAPDPERASPETTLRADARFVFGETPRAVPSRLPDGHAAGLVPIFDTPAAHPDATLERSQPNGPEDWAMRAKTLAFGHSNSEDPRYGNGGLLGHDLGGTIAVPSEWTSADSVRAFARATLDSRVDVAVRDSSTLPGRDGSDRALWKTLVSENPACRAILGEQQAAPAGAVTDTQPYRGTFDAASIHAPTGSAAASARPFRLDGSRRELIDSALASGRLRSLLEHRGVAAFSAPLVASRDPLIPAAEEALLSPERGGAWTLSGPLAESLANVSLLREASPIWVGSLSSLVTHWRRSRRVRMRWTPRGALLVEAPGERSISGFTLLVDGAHLGRDAITIDAADDVQLRHSDVPVTGADPSPRTWLSWRLEPGATYRLQFDADMAELAPVRWDPTR